MKWHDAALVVRPVALRALHAALLAAATALVDVGLLDGQVYDAVVAVLVLFGSK